ncbi:hypothetical protein GFM44_23340 [Rhizobium leguminosarum bv. viciae]|nr:hypothetical protein [Rhizobium leguminosarum bv. viciae]
MKYAILQTRYFAKIIDGDCVIQTRRAWVPAFFATQAAAEAEIEELYESRCDELGYRLLDGEHHEPSYEVLPMAA